MFEKKLFEFDDAKELVVVDGTINSYQKTQHTM